MTPGPSRATITLCRPDELAAAFEAARGRARPQTNFALPDEPWDVGSASVVCIAALDEGDVVQALVAAMRRAELIVSLPDEPWAASARRDLGRVGDVRPSQPAVDIGASVLNDDQRELLRALAGGMSIPEAAASLFMSVRTAERRVGLARRLLGVRTTAEAILLVEAS